MRFRTAAYAKNPETGMAKSAGVVTAHLGSKLLIAQCDAGQLPPLYADVADGSDCPVGKIVDLYGSVGKPYITVLCGDNKRPDIGDEIYTVPDTKAGHKKRYPYRKRS